MRLSLQKFGSPDDPLPVCLHVTQTVRGVKKTQYIHMTEEEAQHLSNRLQSAAKSQGDGSIEVILDR